MARAARVMRALMCVAVTKCGAAGNVRVGWSTAEGNLQGNVGFDRFSFGYRDVDGYAYLRVRVRT